MDEPLDAVGLGRVRSGVAAMVISAALWAVVTVVLAVAADSSLGSLSVVAWMNLTGGTVALGRGCALAPRPSGGSRGRAPAGGRRVRRRERRVSVWGLSGLDATAVAVSNVALVVAFSWSSDVAVALIVEVWPLLAALLIGWTVRGQQRVGRREMGGALVAVAGVALLLWTPPGDSPARHTAASGPLWAAAALAVAAAALQAVAVTAHQRALERLTQEGTTEEDTPLSSDSPVVPTGGSRGGPGGGPGGVVRAQMGLQAARMLGAGVAAALLALGWGTWSAPSGGGQWALVGGAGVAAALSAHLFARGVHAARDASVTLVWLLTPAVTAALMVAVGVAPAHWAVAGGVVLCLAGTAVTARRPPAPPPGPSPADRGAQPVVGSPRGQSASGGCA